VNRFTKKKQEVDANDRERFHDLSNNDLPPTPSFTAAINQKEIRMRLRRMTLALGAIVAQVIGPSALTSADAYDAAQTQLYLDCVKPGATSCTTALQNADLHLLATGTLITIGGYNTATDGGGGTFRVLGAASSKCPSISSGVTGTVTAGSYTITGTSFDPTIYRAGSVVSNSDPSNQIPPGAEIVKATTSSITMSVPATGSGTGSLDSITIAGSNLGTLLQDGYTPAPSCVVKVNYRGEPHEWGAFGTGGTTDDSAALEAWLAGPGPWDATIPATYETSAPLTCWPNINIRAPANDSRESTLAPIVSIQALSGSFAASGSATIGGAAVLTAQDQCRISGLAIDANNVSSPATSVYVDTVNIIGTGVVIDGHSLLENGWYNVYCNVGVHGGAAGTQLKDSQFNASWSDDIYIGTCANDRLNGDIVALAGKDYIGGCVSQAGIHFTGDDITVLGGVIEQTQGPGLWLDTADHVSATGMFFDSSGLGANGGAGIEIDASKHVSICGNHFDQNDEQGATSPAHVRFGPSGGTTPSQDVTFCGNVYNPDGGAPAFVYDATTSGTATTLSSLYESPESQVTGVFSPGAVTNLLPTLLQSPGYPNRYITGLTLSNDSNPQAVDIASGQASDSTNSAIITLVGTSTGSACVVNLGTSGPGGLDTGSVAANTTYFFFVIAQPGGASTSCIASKSTTPSLSTGYKLFRMVGALYTQGGSAPPVVNFVQSDDTFSLSTSVAFPASGTVGTSSTPVTIGGIPSLINVQVFGRCTAGSAVMLAAGNMAAQAPSSGFSVAPGYMVNALAPNTSFPFSLYTTGSTSASPPSGTINAAAASSGTSLQCSNDGWIWHRGR
jgi:hypothetical protein